MDYIILTSEAIANSGNNCLLSMIIAGFLATFRRLEWDMLYEIVQVKRRVMNDAIYHFNLCM